jgi:UDP-perosamine 4-acetyltransferase
MKASNQDSMIIIGSGGHAKICIDQLQSLNYSIDCCINKAYSSDSPSSIFSIPIISGNEKLQEKFNLGYRKVFVAIGDNQIRENISNYARRIGFDFINIISDKAIVSNSAVLGSGILIMPGAIINAGVEIGSHSIINTGAIVEHECLISEYSHVASNTVLLGKVEIGTNTLIGAGSTVLPNVKIGARVTVGAGSVVTRNVLDDQVVMGNPAKFRPKDS